MVKQYFLFAAILAFCQSEWGLRCLMISTVSIERERLLLKNDRRDRAKINDLITLSVSRRERASNLKLECSIAIYLSPTLECFEVIIYNVLANNEPSISEACRSGIFIACKRISMIRFGYHACTTRIKHK